MREKSTTGRDRLNDSVFININIYKGFEKTFGLLHALSWKVGRSLLGPVSLHFNTY